MQTVQTTGSATILAFPARGRFASSNPHNGALAAALATASLPVVDAGAWYHAEAVSSTQPARTR
ncbi:DUF2735 domain-containing protein [Methylopila henanensis]|uniref:DUF2735 domain-containing protein n=1 Tax=Methylopila henanensis TaxID=873516 RepID=A0ABW4K543_9HYPH